MYGYTLICQVWYEYVKGQKGVFRTRRYVLRPIFTLRSILYRDHECKRQHHLIVVHSLAKYCMPMPKSHTDRQPDRQTDRLTDIVIPTHPFVHVENNVDLLHLRRIVLPG